MRSIIEFGVRYRRSIRVAVLLVTALLGVGLTRTRLETGLLSWLPQDHPNVRAFHEVFESLPGAVNQELVWLELDPVKSERLGVTSISDHAALLAQNELFSFVKARVPDVRGVFGVVPWLKILHGIGSTASQKDPGLSASPAETRMLWALLESHAPHLVEALVSEERDGTVISFILDSAPSSPSARDVGRALHDAIASYKQDTSRRFDLFRDEYLVPTGLISGSAVLDDILRRDLLILTPISIVFLIMVLRLVLGSWRTALGVIGILSVSLISVLGLMGWLDSPLNVVTASLIPLLLGTSINYSILVALDALDRRAHGSSPEDALSGIANSSARAIAVTTLTTVAGLTCLLFSDSIGISQLGLLAIVGMTILGLLAVLVVPAFVTSLTPPRQSRIGPIIVPIATSFTRNRTVVLIVYVLTIGVAIMAVRRPVVLLDVIGGNYPADHPILKSVERIKEKCGGTFPELVIATGDLSSPEALDTVRAVEDRLAQSKTIGTRFQRVGFLELLGFHSLIQDKSMPEVTLGLIRASGDVRQAVPTTPKGLRSVVDSLYSDPNWAPLASMFIARDLSVGTVILLGGDAGTDFTSVETTWTELERIVETAPTDGKVKLSFLGYRTIAYLFVTRSLEWLRLTACVALIGVLVLTAMVIREFRAVMTVAILMTSSSLIWFGTLQLVGIYISIFLLFPLVFTVCVGSDYALHILCRLRADRLSRDGETIPRELEWTHSAWASTGRAIAIAAFTDGSVFLIYSQMNLVSASHVMLSVALAVGAVFGLTVFLVPALVFPRTSESSRPPR